MKHLCDSNVFFALAVGQHARHSTAAAWFSQLSNIKTSSPKVWMDAYLAAFAITSGLRFVTFDRDFQKFRTQGLDLVIL